MKKRYRIYIVILEKYNVVDNGDNDTYRVGTTLHYLVCKRFFRKEFIDRHRDWDINMNVVTEWVKKFKVNRIFVTYKIPKFILK